MKTPTQKQIELVENMTHILNIDFPCSSKDFTRAIYRSWISSHIEDYKDIIDATICDEDYCYDMCENDVWCEYY